MARCPPWPRCDSNTLYLARVWGCFYENDSPARTRGCFRPVTPLRSGRRPRPPPGVPSPRPAPRPPAPPLAQPFPPPHVSQHRGRSPSATSPSRGVPESRAQRVCGAAGRPCGRLSRGPQAGHARGHGPWAAGAASPRAPSPGLRGEGSVCRDGRTRHCSAAELRAPGSSEPSALGTRQPGPGRKGGSR